MHEYSIASRIAGILEEVAKEHGQRVVGATVAIGPISMIVPELLYEAWIERTADTDLCGAELHIEHIPIRARCEECDTETESFTPFVKCSKCGSLRLKLLSGHELQILDADLTESEET